MGKSAKGHITLKQTLLEIDRLVIDDKPTVDYVRSLGPDSRLGGVVNCLTLGARALSYAHDRASAADVCEQINASATSTRQLLEALGKNTQENIERSVRHFVGQNGTLPKAIKDELAGLERELQKHLDPEVASSITSRIRRTISQDLKGVVQQLAHDLDPSNDAGPLGRLRTELDKKHDAILKHLADLAVQHASSAAASTQRMKSSAKGADFEAAVEQALAALCGPRKDLVDRVGTQPGDKRSRRGDFVIQIDSGTAQGRDVRIVVETKNDRSTTARSIRGELEEAITNRSAAVAVGLSCNPGFLASGSSVVQAVDDDKIVAYVQFDEKAGVIPDTLSIEAALEMARYKALARGPMRAEHLDIVQIDALAKSAIATLDRFTSLKTKIGTIRQQADDASAYVDQLRGEVRRALDELRASIAAHIPKGAPNGASRATAA